MWCPWHLWPSPAGFPEFSLMFSCGTLHLSPPVTGWRLSQDNWGGLQRWLTTDQSAIWSQEMVGSEYVSTIVRRFSWGHPLRFLKVSFCTRFLPDPEISSRLFQYSPSLFNPPPNPSCSHHYPPPVSIQEIHSPWAKLRTINLPLLDLFQSFEIYCYFMNENILYHDEHHIYSSIVTQYSFTNTG